MILINLIPIKIYIATLHFCMIEKKERKFDLIMKNLDFLHNNCSILYLVHYFRLFMRLVQIIINGGLYID